MSDPLTKEKDYLLSNLEEFAKVYPGKYLLIKDEAVWGAYETYDQGVREGIRRLGTGPFLVRSVLQPHDPEAPSIPALAIGVPLIDRP